jgi:hypothetical protein
MAGRQLGLAGVILLLLRPIDVGPGGVSALVTRRPVVVAEGFVGTPEPGTIGLRRRTRIYLRAGA